MKQWMLTSDVLVGHFVHITSVAVANIKTGLGDFTHLLGMSFARAVIPLRATLRPTPLASSSRRTLVTRSPNSDRYLAIHAFFTRHSSLSTPQLPSARSQLFQRRWNSSQQSDKQCANCETKQNASASPPNTHSQATKPRKDHAQDYAPFIRRLIASSKVIKQGSPHRPSKEELLAAASGWFERLRIRIKWFTIRGWRRFNMDDLSAFASWFVVGNSEFSARLVAVGCLRLTSIQHSGS